MSRGHVILLHRLRHVALAFATLESFLEVRIWHNYELFTSLYL